MVVSKPINYNNPKTAKTHKKRRGKRRKSKRHKKSGPMPTNKKIKEDAGGPVDEKGNPFPIDNPEGGDPICPGGYKIDYDFDPFNDPINPPFRCISSLKDPNDAKPDDAKNKDENDIKNKIDNTANELQTDEDTIRGGGGGSGSGSTKKYKHRSSYSKTRRHRHRHRHRDGHRH
jgi:hypothetical protein